MQLAGRLHPPEELDAGALPYLYLVYRCCDSRHTPDRGSTLTARPLQMLLEEDGRRGPCAAAQEGARERRGCSPGDCAGQQRCGLHSRAPRRPRTPQAAHSRSLPCCQRAVMVRPLHRLPTLALVQVLLPPLRSDMAALPLPLDTPLQPDPSEHPGSDSQPSVAPSLVSPAAGFQARAPVPLLDQT